MLGITEPYAAYCVDQAVVFAGQNYEPPKSKITL